MRRLNNQSVFFAALLTLVSACTPPGPVPVRSSPDAPEQAADAAAGPEGIARAVVAERTGSPADELELISSDYEEFSDSGLGCPVEGRAYLQVITPGYRVVLKAQGQLFDVRVAGSRGRICERASAN